MKKFLSIVLIMILMIGMLGEEVNVLYAVSLNSASMSSSSQSVTEGETVTITVSLGQSVSAAQFILNFDSNKLQYVSKTGKGTYFPSTKRYSYYSEEDKEDLSQVSFTFETKTVGTTQIGVTDLKVSKGDMLGEPISVNNAVTITIKENVIEPIEPPTSDITPDIEPEPTPDVNIEEPVKPTKKPTTPTTSNNETNETNQNNLPNDTNTTNTVENQIPQNNEENNNKPAPNEIIKLTDTNSVRIEDKKTNIIIKALEIALKEKNIVLDTMIIEKDSEIYKKIDNIIKDINGKKTYYDIKLLESNIVIQPNGYVTVYIPIPDGYNKDSLALYYVDEKNERYEIRAGEVQENYYTFTTNHFSIYALVDSTDSKIVNMKKDSGEYTIVLFIIITLIIAIIIIEVLTKIEKMKENKKY